MTVQAPPARAAELPQTNRAGALDVATAQQQALLLLLRELGDADWDRPTDCAGWRVRDIAAHVAGAMDEGAHLRVAVRHLRAAKRSGRGSLVDGLNEAQLADRRTLPVSGILADLERLAPKAARRRRQAPALIRRRAVPGEDLPAGSTFGYLFDVIVGRDAWMHRVDVARACGRPFVPVSSDTEVVAQIVRDLGRF
ncbi:MAG: maleylpyruvate isomerase family mycothiol-dependent enzyme, partial [Streptosporangiaceae bacterium]